ncbi:hypothetical protein [Rhizobium sullae]|uniref:Uncharacterized protein n=2 Tax=Rhizobium sullae TaxID=50338 RepID=A0A2N0D7V5_RHISU|nr:hypothetical protein [Rhizobium sullae]PKA42161.1 hypothetical protein CWR43_18775 [Rhizobium sullae]
MNGVSRDDARAANLTATPTLETAEKYPILYVARSGIVALLRKFHPALTVEQSWMPKIRALCAEVEQQGKAVVRLASVEEIDAFALSQAAAKADKHIA